MGVESSLNPLLRVRWGFKAYYLRLQEFLAASASDHMLTQAARPMKPLAANDYRKIRTELQTRCPWLFTPPAPSQKTVSQLVGSPPAETPFLPADELAAVMRKSSIPWGYPNFYKGKQREPRNVFAAIDVIDYHHLMQGRRNIPPEAIVKFFKEAPIKQRRAAIYAKYLPCRYDSKPLIK